MPAKLRVALVTPDLSRLGGVERVVAIAARSLTKRGHEVTVLTESPPGDVTERHALPVGLFSESRDLLPHWARKSEMARAARLISERADLVDFHRAVSTSLLRRLSATMATVVTVHAPEMTCPAGTRYLPRSDTLCEHTPGLNCWNTDRREGCMVLGDGAPFGWKSRVRTLFRTGLARRASQWAGCMVFNSNATRDQFSRFVGAPACGRVIPEPLEEQPHSARPRERGRLIFVGRLVAVKGGIDAISVAAAIPQGSLDIVGEGPQRPLLEQHAASLGMEKRVTFHGWKSTGEVARLMSGAMCMLVPSHWFEAWGMVGPEAIAQGCPVVAYDSGGIREWCLPRYGTVVPHGDIQAMTAAAREWMSRMHGGLDTSVWHAEAHQLWGEARYVEQYTEAAQAALQAFQKRRR